MMMILMGGGGVGFIAETDASVWGISVCHLFALFEISAGLLAGRLISCGAPQSSVNYQERNMQQSAVIDIPQYS